MEKNGLPWGKGSFHNRGDNTYCIWGQAGYNLSVTPAVLYRAVNNLDISWNAPAGTIAVYNDEAAQTYEEVLGYARKILEPYNDKFVVIDDLYLTKETLDAN